MTTDTALGAVAGIVAGFILGAVLVVMTPSETTPLDDVGRQHLWDIGNADGWQSCWSPTEPATWIDDIDPTGQRAYHDGFERGVVACANGETPPNGGGM